MLKSPCIITLLLYKISKEPIASRCACTRVRWLQNVLLLIVMMQVQKTWKHICTIYLNSIKVIKQEKNDVPFVTTLQNNNNNFLNCYFILLTTQQTDKVVII